MFLMERNQFVEDVTPRLHAAGVGALGFPGIGQTAEVVVALQEVVGDSQQGGAEPTVGAADQRVDKAALHARGAERPFDGLVVIAGLLDGDHEILQPVP